MSVYNDMANDAGYRYGSDENRQMAQMIEAEHERQWKEEMNRKLEEQMEYERMMEEQEAQQ